MVSKLSGLPMSCRRHKDPISQTIYSLPPFYRICVVLFGAVLIHLTIGTYHTFGNILPYMASYMRTYTDKSIRLEHMMWIPTFQGCFPFAMVIGGTTMNIFSPRISAFIGCLLVTMSVSLSGYAIQHSFALFFITYGLMFGLGMGIAYVTAVSTVINWAPDKVGLVSGIVAAGFGVSSSIFAPIQTWIVNPDNLPSTKDGYFVQSELLMRVPYLFRTLAVVYAIMQLVALVVVCDPPFRLHESPDDSTEEADDDQDVFISNENATGPQLSPSEMLRSTTFYCLFVALFCCSFYANMFYNLYKTFAESFIDDDFFIAMAFSVGSIANAIARIGWGYLTDRTSFQVSLSTATCLATFFLLTMPMTKEFGKYMYLAWLIGTFICMGATHALFITATVKCFGTRHKANNYGFLIFSTTCSGILLSAISEFYLKSIGYTWLFVFTSGFPFCAFIIISLIQHTPHGTYVI